MEADIFGDTTLEEAVLGMIGVSTFGVGARGDTALGDCVRVGVDEIDLGLVTLGDEALGVVDFGVVVLTGVPLCADLDFLCADFGVFCMGATGGSGARGETARGDCVLVGVEGVCRFDGLLPLGDAFGVAAFGVAAFGVAAFGVASLGTTAFGVAAFGVAAFGVASLGTTAFGVAAFGVENLGVFALGFGEDALGVRGGRGALGDTALGDCVLVGVEGVNALGELLWVFGLGDLALVERTFGVLFFCSLLLVGDGENNNCIATGVLSGVAVMTGALCADIGVLYADLGVFLALFFVDLGVFLLDCPLNQSTSAGDNFFDDTDPFTTLAEKRSKKIL